MRCLLPLHIPNCLRRGCCLVLPSFDELSYIDSAFLFPRHSFSLKQHLFHSVPIVQSIHNHSSTVTLVIHFTDSTPFTMDRFGRRFNDFPRRSNDNADDAEDWQTPEHPADCPCFDENADDAEERQNPEHPADCLCANVNLSCYPSSVSFCSVLITRPVCNSTSTSKSGPNDHFG